MSSDLFENPFREGGKLSRDAEVIIDALKTGKLSVISNQVMIIMMMMLVKMTMIIIIIIDALKTAKVFVISNQVMMVMKMMLVKMIIIIIIIDALNTGSLRYQ